MMSYLYVLLTHPPIAANAITSVSNPNRLRHGLKYSPIIHVPSAERKVSEEKPSGTVCVDFDHGHSIRVANR